MVTLLSDNVKEFNDEHQLNMIWSEIDCVMGARERSGLSRASSLCELLARKFQPESAEGFQKLLLSITHNEQDLLYSNLYAIYTQAGQVFTDKILRMASLFDELIPVKDSISSPGEQKAPVEVASVVAPDRPGRENPPAHHRGRRPRADFNVPVEPEQENGSGGSDVKNDVTPPEPPRPRRRGRPKAGSKAPAETKAKPPAVKKSAIEA